MLYSYTYIYILFDSCITIKHEKMTHLFTDGYKMAAQRVV